MSNLTEREINEINVLFENIHGTSNYSESQKEKLKKFCENKSFNDDHTEQQYRSNIKQKELALRRWYYHSNRKEISELEEQIQKLRKDEIEMFNSEDFKKYYPSCMQTNQNLINFDIAKNYVHFLELVCGGIRSNIESMKVFVNYLKESNPQK